MKQLRIMMKPLFKSLIGLCGLTLILSCDKPVCENTNPVFDQYAPHSKEYKDELARQLKLVDNSKLSYWMGIYVEKNNLRYIYADIQGDGLCAVIVSTVKDSQEGIEGILKAKGMGYRGAELRDLKFDLLQDSSGTEFIFKSVDSIVD